MGKYAIQFSIEVDWCNYGGNWKHGEINMEGWIDWMGIGKVEMLNAWIVVAWLENTEENKLINFAKKEKEKKKKHT